MSEMLILRLGQSPEDPVKWALIEDDVIQQADIANSVGDLADIAAPTARCQVIAVLPGEQAAMRSISTPPKAASKFRAAATFLLEDELAEDLENLHLAVVRRENGAGTVLALKENLMVDWLDAFEQSGLSPDIVTADYALLPLNADGAVLLVEPTRIVGAVGMQGFAAERPLADTLLEELVADETNHEVVAFGDRDYERISIGAAPIVWRGGADDPSIFRLYADGVRQNGVPNLRQGAYRKRRDWRGAIGAWRRAGMLAAACVILFVGVSIADSVRLTRLADKLEAETLSLHQTAFPAQASADPRTHARAILASNAGAPAFLSLATRFAESLEDNGQIQVDRIRYNAQRGEFSISLRFADINDLEELKQLLAGRGVNATEAGGVRRNGGLYVGELTVSTS